MRINSFMKPVLTFLSVVGVGMGAQTAEAASCGISGTAVGSTIDYDPFHPGGLAPTTVTMNLTRINPPGGGKTSTVNFYLKADSLIGTGADGTSLIPTAVAGSVNAQGTGNNIFYNYNATPPVISPTTLLPTSSSRFLHIDFTGNNAGSDTATVTFLVSLPQNMDVSQAPSLAFTAYFACTVTGGPDNNVQQTGSITNAVVFPVRILNALQAYYSGGDMDFGDISEVTNVAAPSQPMVNPTQRYINVRSSGAYQVELSSAKDYRLTFTGSNPADPNHWIPYSLHFMGRDLTTGSSFTPINCSYAGVPIADSDQLNITPTLVEGGKGKTVANYQDELTVTVTPQLGSATAGADCPAL